MCERVAILPIASIGRLFSPLLTELSLCEVSFTLILSHLFRKFHYSVFVFSLCLSAFLQIPLNLRYASTCTISDSLLERGLAHFTFYIDRTSGIKSSSARKTQELGLSHYTCHKLFLFFPHNVNLIL